jgi:hypothetical protein
MTEVCFYVAKKNIHIGTNVIFKGTMFFCSFYDLPLPEHADFLEYFSIEKIFISNESLLNNPNVDTYERT